MNTTNILLDILIKKLEASVQTQAEKIAVLRLRKQLKSPYAIEYQKRLYDILSNHPTHITTEILDEAYEYFTASEELNLEKSNLTDKEKENEKVKIKVLLKAERNWVENILKREGLLK